MALALPQAAQAPPKAGLANLKVPAAAVPLKLGDHQATHPKTKFQTLLDQLAQAVKPQGEPAADGAKGKAKVKALEAPAEKVKDAKKPEPKDGKDGKTESYEAAMASLVVAPGKPEALMKAKNADTEGLQGAFEKAKAPVKDKRAGLDGGVPAPVTAAAAEVARFQAQQNGPRTERSEEKQRVFVVDRRTDAKEKEKLKLPGAEAAAQQPVNAAEFQAQQTKIADAKTAAAEVQVTFQSVAGKAKEGFDLKSQNTPVSPRDAATFQQYLVEKGYGQLVDQARIVLKDQNAGEIRMTLYPESLGKVKVSLDLSDNSLAGQIFVENQTVKDVFQKNMNGLMEAFREGGWDNMSLEVSVGNGNGGKPNGEQPSQTAGQARDYGRQVTQTGPLEGRTDRIGSWNDRQINLTA